MRKKINQMLVVIALFATVASTICTTWIFYSLFQNQVMEDLRNQAVLLRSTGMFSRTSPVPELSGLQAPFHAELNKLRLTWIDARGDVLFDSFAQPGALDNHAGRPEFMEAQQTGECRVIRNSESMHSNTYYYALRLDDGAVLRISTQANSLWSAFEMAIPWILLIILCSCLASLGMAHLLTRRMMKPIEQMTQKIAATNDSSGGAVKMSASLENMRAMSSDYHELAPFIETICAQHEKILAAARSRQDFTANVSHELKTPLTAIAGYAELIENGMVPADKTTQYSHEIHRNAERLVSLINDIIRLSELDSSTMLHFEDTDLYQLVSADMDELRIAAEKRQIRLYFEGQSCPVHVCRDMMHELVENLVQNAIRYNNPGGSVWISVRKENEHPTLTIGDNGIGIPKDQQERVFERFYRVDKSRSRATGGTGLGLAIVKHIVELHHAQILLESEEGRGTTITMIL